MRYVITAFGHHQDENMSDEIRPLEEIEITEEMIEAGMRVLSRHGSAENPDVAVCAVFAAMVAKSDKLRKLLVVW